MFLVCRKYPLCLLPASLGVCPPPSSPPWLSHYGLNTSVKYCWSLKCHRLPVSVLSGSGFSLVLADNLTMLRSLSVEGLRVVGLRWLIWCPRIREQTLLLCQCLGMGINEAVTAPRNFTSEHLREDKETPASPVWNLRLGYSLLR